MKPELGSFHNFHGTSKLPTNLIHVEYRRDYKNCGSIYAVRVVQTKMQKQKSKKKKEQRKEKQTKGVKKFIETELYLHFDHRRFDQSKLVLGKSIPKLKYLDNQNVIEIDIINAWTTTKETMTKIA